MQAYFDSEFIRISYNETTSVVVNAWKTPPSSDEFKIGMENLLEAIKHFKIGKILSDTTYMGAIHPDDQHWTATDWYHRAAKVGFSHNAIVVPPDVFTEMSVKEILDQIENTSVTTSFFQTVEDATAWIQQFILYI